MVEFKKDVEYRLARTAGFCMGVRRAMDMVLELSGQKESEVIYTLGPLIHNPQAVDFLKGKKIIPIQDLDRVNGETVVIRAHGISPREQDRIREKGIKIVDATCPKVKFVQSIIKKHAQLGFSILIIGDRDHPEVEGLLGYTQNRGRVIGSIQDVESVPALERVCVVAQTTQNIEEFASISRAILKRSPGALIFRTVCDSTERRQAEVRELASNMDAMFIVGGKNSANTRRLAKISETQGKPTFHIETAQELKSIDLTRFKKIGISAGASTPNWVIRDIVSSLKKIGRAYKS